MIDDSAGPSTGASKRSDPKSKIPILVQFEFHPEISSEGCRALLVLDIPGLDLMMSHPACIVRGRDAFEQGVLGDCFRAQEASKNQIDLAFRSLVEGNESSIHSKRKCID